MRRYLMIGLTATLLISLVFVSLSKETPSAYVEMEVKGVRMDITGQSPVVILVDKDEKKALPIWIGLLEANAIDRELRNIPSQRPMTHDLLHSILMQTQVKVKEVRIVEMKDNTYYAKLFLMQNRDLIEVDARPSDAIILALKSKMPVLVSGKILDEQGVALAEKDVGERYGIRIQELTPSLASHFNFKGERGVLVSEVVSGSASEASGIRAGDIITKIGRKEVGNIKDFEEAFDTIKSGSSVRMTLFRDDKFREVDFSLNP